MTVELQRHITVVGGGRAGSALCAALASAGWTTDLVVRKSGRRQALAQWYADNDLSVRLHASFVAALAAQPVIFATADRDLPGASEQFAAAVGCAEAPWLHLSGVAPPSALRVDGGAENLGSCHPLCAILGPFAGDRTVSSVIKPLRGALFAVAGTPQAQQLASQVATACGGLPVAVGLDERAAYHAAASIVANDLVALLAIAERLFSIAGLQTDKARPALLHLAKTSLDAIAVASTKACSSLADGLTGAVGRADAGTLQAHFGALETDREGQRAHALLSAILLGEVGERLSADQRAAVTKALDAVLEGDLHQ